MRWKLWKQHHWRSFVSMGGGVVAMCNVVVIITDASHLCDHAPSKHSLELCYSKNKARLFNLDSPQ